MDRDSHCVDYFYFMSDIAEMNPGLTPYLEEYYGKDDLDGIVEKNYFMYT
jgi:hypothetical protein